MRQFLIGLLIAFFQWPLVARSVHGLPRNRAAQLVITQQLHRVEVGFKGRGTDAVSLA